MSLQPGQFIRQGKLVHYLAQHRSDKSDWSDESDETNVGEAHYPKFVCNQDSCHKINSHGI